MTPQQMQAAITSYCETAQKSWFISAPQKAVADAMEKFVNSGTPAALDALLALTMIYTAPTQEQLGADAKKLEQLTLCGML